MRRKKTLVPVIVSIVGALLTVALTAALLVAFSLRQTALKSSVPEVIENMDLEKWNITANDGSSQPIAEYLKEQFVLDERVTVEDVEELLQNGSFGEYAADFLDQYNDYLLHGGTAPKLDADVVLGMLRENEDLIREKTNLTFDEDELRSQLEDSLSAVDASLRKSAGNQLVRLSFSVWTEVVLGILLALILLWMILTFIHARRSGGTAMVIFGTAALVPCLALLITVILTDQVLHAAKLDALTGAVRTLRNDLYIYSGTAAMICIVLLGTGLVINILSGSARAQRTESSVFYDPTDDGVQVPVQRPRPAPQPVQRTMQQPYNATQRRMPMQQSNAPRPQRAARNAAEQTAPLPVIPASAPVQQPYSDAQRRLPAQQSNAARPQQDAPKAAPEAICPICGWHSAAGAKFCKRCGRQFG